MPFWCSKTRYLTGKYALIMVLQILWKRVSWKGSMDLPQLCNTCHLWNVSKVLLHYINPDSKGHGANMGHIWDRQDPDGPRVGLMNFAIWEGTHNTEQLYIRVYCIIAWHLFNTEQLCNPKSCVCHRALFNKANQKFQISNIFIQGTIFVVTVYMWSNWKVLLAFICYMDGTMVSK